MPIRSRPKTSSICGTVIAPPNRAAVSITHIRAVGAELDLGVGTAVAQPQRVDGVAREGHDALLGVGRQRGGRDAGAFGERLDGRHPTAEADGAEGRRR